MNKRKKRYINNRLAEERKKLGISQSELARRIGLSSQAISAFENGDRNPKPENWNVLSKFFDKPIRYLQGFGLHQAQIENEILTILNTIYSDDAIHSRIDIFQPLVSAINDHYLFIGDDPHIVYMMNESGDNLNEELVKYYKSRFYFLFDNKELYLELEGQENVYMICMIIYKYLRPIVDDERNHSKLGKYLEKINLTNTRFLQSIKTYSQPNYIVDDIKDYENVIHEVEETFSKAKDIKDLKKIRETTHKHIKKDK